MQPEMKVQNHAQVTKDMIQPLNGRERILLSSAITIMRRLKEPMIRMETGPLGIVSPVEYHEAEQELPQMELKWTRWPIPESYIDKALDDLKLAVKKQMREAGFMR